MPRPAWTCDLARRDYEPVADLQRSLRAAREAGAIPDTLLLVEHEPVITAGHRTTPDEVAMASTHGLNVVPTERGGKATWHGPGQVVAYPIFDLNGHGKDIKQFVRQLEQATIDTLAGFDIDADRREGYPGVWTAGKKIASIGIRVTRWVSFHGIAINVDCDLEPFSWFMPCGIPDVEMTSIAAEAGHSIDLEAVRAQVMRQIAGQFGLGPMTSVTTSRLEAIGAEYPVDRPTFADSPVVAHARVVDLAGAGA